MDTVQALQKAEELLGKVAAEFRRPEDFRLDVILPAASLLDAVKILVENHWGYLSFITGLDHPAPAPAEGEAPKPDDGTLEVLYHFCEGAAITTLRVSLPYQNTEIKSVCGIIPSATLYERELMEMFGIQVIGTPDPRRLLLPDDWPDGVYPLRKSYKGVASPESQAAVEA